MYKFSELEGSTPSGNADHFDSGKYYSEIYRDDKNIGLLKCYPPSDWYLIYGVYPNETSINLSARKFHTAQKEAMAILSAKNL